MINYNIQNERKYFNILFLCCLFRNTIIFFLILILGRIPIVGRFNIYIYMAFIFFLVVCAFPTFRRIITTDFIFVFFVLFSILFSLCIGINEYFNQNIAKLLLAVYPFYFLGRHFNYYENIKIGKKTFSMEDTIYFLSVIGIILMFSLQFYRILQGSYNRILENSGGATYTKPLLGFCCFYMFKHKKLHSILIVILGFFAMFSYGNRTSLLAVCIIFVVASMFYINIRKVKSFLLLIVETIVVLFVYNNLNVIISSIGNYLSYFGFNTRITDMFLGVTSNNILYDSGRSSLYIRARELIVNGPLWGYGLFGDRKLLPNGAYVHNIFLELMIDYGLICGSILSFLVIILVVKSIIINWNDKGLLSFILAIAISEFVMLMVSGSYLQEGLLFMLIGLCLSTGSTKKKNK